MAGHWVGTSGWSYDGWRGRFYPRSLRKVEWLACYAQSFRTVEINASFYHLPKVPVMEGWAAHTPADFRFAVKAWRAITHYRRLLTELEPDVVHVLAGGRIVASGGPELAAELEETGYAGYLGAEADPEPDPTAAPSEAEDPFADPFADPLA